MEMGYASPQDTADSPARTDMALILHRAARLVAALLDGLFEHPGSVSA
jgi:hypothetical protein